MISNITPRALRLTIRMGKYINKRNVFFLILTAVAVGMGYTPLRDLLFSTDHGEYYSHIVLIPLVSGYLVYLKRKELILEARYGHGSGIILMTVGIALYFHGITLETQLDLDEYSSLMILSVLVFWIGGFILIFGTRVFRIAIFPLLFLAFMIPIPSMLMDKIIHFLLAGSNEVTYRIFELTGIPVSREGFVFHLPGISVEIAKQCSGIRSSLALLITVSLAAHFFLKSGWRKAILILSIVPIAILKNGIRIVTLSILAVYVDEKFITQGFLHRSGGFVFFLPALALLGLILWGLRKSER